MTHDVFISYSSRDKAAADAIVNALESAGVRCWVAPRDILPGRTFGAAIIDGLNASKVMLLVYSAHSNASQQVMREVERAVNRSMPVVPVRLENVPMSGDMEYFMSSAHWLDALTPPFESHVERIRAAVESLLSAGAGQPPEAVTPAAPPRPSKWPRRRVLVAGGVLATAGLGFGAVQWFTRGGQAANSAGADARPRYKITEIRAFGGANSEAYAINNAGQVTGYAETADGKQRPFLFSNGNLSDLGALSESANRSVGFAINADGRVVGVSETGEASVQHAVLYGIEGIQDLGTPGGVHSTATGINSSGVICGYGSPEGQGERNTATAGFYRPFIYDKVNGLRLIPILEGYELGSTGTMNNLGQVPGGSHIRSTGWRGTIYDIGTGKLTALSEEGVGQSFVAAINDVGLATGWMGTSRERGLAFLYNVRDESILDLGNLGGGFSDARALNDAGDVVGTSHIARGKRHAFVYRNGAMADLNSLIPADSGWELNIATGINHLGQIVGYGKVSGVTRAFLLTPEKGR